MIAYKLKSALTIALALIATQALAEAPFTIRQTPGTAPLIEATQKTVQFSLTLNANCALGTKHAMLSINIADTLKQIELEEHQTADQIVTIEVPSAQLSGLQSQVLCPRIQKHNPLLIKNSQALIRQAFSAQSLLSCESESATFRAQSSAALDALIQCAPAAPALTSEAAQPEN